MKIAYVCHSRFPTEKAYGHQMAQVCDALTENGHEITFFRPRIVNRITQDPREYYALHGDLRTETIESFDALSARWIPERFAAALINRSYAKCLRRYLNSSHYDALILRSAPLLPTLLRTNMPIIFEAHTLPRVGVRSFAAQLQRCALVVCLTSMQRNALIAAGVAAARIVVEPDGVDLRRFENKESPMQAKNRWKLPRDRTIIGYCGSLVTRTNVEKGVRTIIEAMVTVRKQSPDALAWIIGGPQEWMEKYEKISNNTGLKDVITFQGPIAAQDVPSALAACDICIYPAPASDDPFFLRDTSPMKLFEYMAAGKAIICAGIPPVHDVLNDGEATFFRPGDAAALARAIQSVKQSTNGNFPLPAPGKIARFDWRQRMGRIIEAYLRRR